MAEFGVFQALSSEPFVLGLLISPYETLLLKFGEDVFTFTVSAYCHIHSYYPG